MVRPLSQLARLASALAAMLAAAPSARAVPALRHQLEVNGDFALVGNTLAHDCAAGIPTPLVPSARPSACGSRTTDSGVDVYWVSNPLGGTASADVAYAPSQAQSTAVLQLPAGAVVRYARVYWAAVVSSNAWDTAASLQLPDGAAYPIAADDGVTAQVSTRWWYQSTADVTALVQGLAEPRGGYTLAGADSADFRNQTNDVVFGAWWMAVFYELPGGPVTRQLTLFDGLDYVSADVQVSLSGFRVPTGGWDAKLGVVTYEGDDRFSGDELWFKGYTLPAAPPAPAGQTRLSDAQNPATNFFNGTRSWLGAPVTVAGDLPQLTGGPASMSSFDLDVVDLKAAGAIASGNDAAVIRATTGGDLFGLGGFVASISTLRPSFVETVKSVAPVPDDGAVLAGDTLRYTVTATNTGSDASVNTVVRDTLPVGVTFVPGSVTFSGPNGGVDYDAATRTLTARVGAGADATQGGSIPIGGSFTIAFDVTIDAGVSGTIVNSAVVSAAGAAGDPQTDFPSYDPSGEPGTAAPVDACLADAQCGGSTPACDTAPTPNVCVACTADAHCSGATPFCDVPSRQCIATTSISPTSQERTTIAGTGVPLPMTLTSHLSGPETYDLDVPAGACGWDVALLDGSGALVATRDGAGAWSGGDTNGNGLPDLGPTGPDGGTTSFQLRLAPPAGTPAGNACTAIVIARGAASSLTAQASATARVGLSVTYTPDHAGGSAKTVGSGAIVNFPGVVQNNGPAAASFALSASESTIPAAGALAPMVFYSDPDADGDPADGAPITETGGVAPFGGQVHVVLQVRASTAGGPAVAAGTAISVTANAGAAVQQDEATVGYLATFADAGGAVSTRSFAPCSTVYLRATRLPAGPEYVLEWYAQASPVRGTDTPVRTVYPWLVVGGAASDALALGAAAAPGTWTAVVVQRSGGVDTVLDQLPVAVERAGVFTLLSAPARLVLGAALEVGASFRNDDAAATLASTNLSYAVTDGAQWMDGAGAFAADPARRARFTSGVTVAAGATAADGFTVLAPAWPAPGQYQVNAEWQLSCGATPLVASAATQIDVAPPPPAIDTPASGALVGTATPTVGGFARPGAGVAISIDGQPFGPVAADAGGRFDYALLAGEALGQGTHSVTAVQTENGVTSDPSAPRSFTVDTSAPAVSVTFPADGGLVGSAQAPGGAVTVTGGGEAGSSVSVQIGATTVAATWAGPVWSASFTLADGPHAAIATATDAAGNAASAGASFTLDTVAPGAPTIDAPAAGAALNATTAVGGVVTVSGTGDASATIAVTVGGQTRTATRAGAAFSATFTLADGPHTASAVATDAAGNGSTPASASFSLDATPPAAPAFGAPAPGEVLNAATAPGGVVTVSGTAEAGATVTVDVGGDVRTLPAAAGTWSDSFTLSQGSHGATATAADAAGNVSAPASLSFSVDTVLPAAATVDPVASPTAAAPVHVTGTAEPGATVRLYEGGVLRGEAVAGAGGTFDVSAALTEGSHTLSVRVFDPAGNEAASAPTVALVVDRTGPAAPVIVAPADGAVLGAADLVSGQVAFSGTAEADAAIEIYVDGSLADGATADGAGAWSRAIAVSSGTHTARARAVDAAGNASPQGTATTFTVDAAVPQAPVLASPAGPVSTNAAVLTVSGTAEADATLEVRLDGVVVDTVVADALGGFSRDLVLPASDGTWTLTTVAVDGAGNRSPPSAGVAVTVDRTAPAAASVTAPAAGGWVATGTVAVAGSAEPGATVRVTADTGAVVDAIAAADGSFQATLSLADGARTVVVRVTDAAGNASADVSRGFTVDTVKPAAPTIGSPASGTFTNAATVTVTGGAPGDAVLVRILDGGTVVASGAPSGTFGIDLAPGEGTHVLAAVAVDAAGNVSDPSASVTVQVDRTAPAAPALAAPASPTNAQTVVFSGSAEAGATVEIVTLAGAVLGSGAADAAGAFAIGIALAEGGATVVARATDAAGNGGPSSSSATVVVDRTAPGAPAVASPADGALLGAADLAAGGLVALSGTAEPGAEVAVEVDGSVSLVLSDASGAWSLDAVLGDGAHGVRAAATDAAGNGSGFGAVRTFTLDTVAPAAPAIASPAAGTLTSAGSVTVTGTAEPGATVVVTVGAAQVSVVADAAGAFQATLPLPAADGATSISAVAVDGAGNGSPPSAGVAMSVDRTAPASPTIDSPADGAGFAPGAVEIRGRAEAGATVTVVAAGTTLAVTAGADGAWSVSIVFPAGTHDVAAAASDGAGNASAAAHVTVVARADDGAGGGGGCGCGAGAGGASSLFALVALLGVAPRVRRRAR